MLSAADASSLLPKESAGFVLTSSSSSLPLLSGQVDTMKSQPNKSKKPRLRISFGIAAYSLVSVGDERAL